MNCPNCGNELNAGAKFCGKCGKPMPTPPSESLNEKVCQRCGNVLNGSAVFCNNCGSNSLIPKKSTEQTVKRCTNCGSPMKDSAAFCGKCGKAVNDSSVQKTREKGKKDGVLIFLIVLLLVAILGCSGVIGYLYYQNNFGDAAIATSSQKDKQKDDDNDNKKTKKHKEDEDTQTEDFSYEDEDEIKTEGFLFPSDKQYITREDLIGKSKEDVALIRNEIYARHGYIFTNEPYKSYFEAMEWYVPNPNFNETIFSELEKTNKDFIVAFEESCGWR